MEATRRIVSIALGRALNSYLHTFLASSPLFLASCFLPHFTLLNPRRSHFLGTHANF